MKKVIEITGEPLFPIKVGENAVISEDGSNTRRTSTVMRVETFQNGKSALKHATAFIICIRSPENQNQSLERYFSTCSERRDIKLWIRD